MINAKKWSKDLAKLIDKFTMCTADDVTLSLAEQEFKKNHSGNYKLAYYTLSSGSAGFTVEFDDPVEQTWWALSQRDYYDV